MHPDKIINYNTDIIKAKIKAYLQGKDAVHGGLSPIIYNNENKLIGFYCGQTFYLDTHFNLLAVKQHKDRI